MSTVGSRLIPQDTLVVGRCLDVVTSALCSYNGLMATMSHRNPWKIRGFGHLKIRLFTIKNLSTCRRPYCHAELSVVVLLLTSSFLRGLAKPPGESRGGVSLWSLQPAGGGFFKRRRGRAGRFFWMLPYLDVPLEVSKRLIHFCFEGAQRYIYIFKYLIPPNMWSHFC